MKKIFFSWQSDIKPVRNKLKSALKTAILAIAIMKEQIPRIEKFIQNFDLGFEIGEHLVDLSSSLLMFQSQLVTSRVT